MERVSIVRESVLRRRSVRSFIDKPIPAAWLDDLIDAGIAAPSGSNWQNQRFLLITDPKEIERIGEIRFVWPYKSANLDRIRGAHPSGIIGRARALIIVFADASLNDARGLGEYYLWESLEIQNCAASIQNILTLATSYGLGSCWISASEKMNHTRLLSGKTWRQALAAYEIPLSYKVQGIVMLGFPHKTDEQGYAVGEKMHGATLWASTTRKARKHYLVQPRKEEDSALGQPSRFALWLCSRAITAGLAGIRALDRVIHRIEHEGHGKTN